MIEGAQAHHMLVEVVLGSFLLMLLGLYEVL
jgi:hypothetical protein